MAKAEPVIDTDSPTDSEIKEKQKYKDGKSRARKKGSAEGKVMDPLNIY